MRPPSRRDVAAAIWAVGSLRRTRRDLRRQRVEDVHVGGPPTGALGAGRAVHSALRLGRATCLERSLVLQAWHRSHGRLIDVVIGVKPPSEGFEAHAWLDGEDPEETARFSEITRLAPERA